MPLHRADEGLVHDKFPHSAPPQPPDPAPLSRFPPLKTRGPCNLP